LTNGAKNIIAADENGFYEIEVNPVKAVNTTGCGDAFTAGLASVLFPCGKSHPGEKSFPSGEREDSANFKAAIHEGMRCGALNAGLVRPGVIR